MVRIGTVAIGLLCSVLVAGGLPGRAGSDLSARGEGAVARLSARGNAVSIAMGEPAPHEAGETPGQATSRQGPAPIARATLDGIEVVQAIQDINGSVPLISGKQTFVRVFVSGTVAGVTSVTGTIRITRSRPTVLTVAAIQPTPLGTAPVRSRREDWAGGLNFQLPADATEAGTASIELVDLSDAATGARIACVGCAPRAVSFATAPPLRVRIVGMTYLDRTGSTLAPRDADYNLLASWLRRAYPVPSVIWTRGEADSTVSPPFQNDEHKVMSCAKVNAALSGYRAVDMSNGADPRTHYYGLVADTVEMLRGCSPVPTDPDPASTASGPAGAHQYGDADGSYADWYGGHELGHSFGRKHPGACGESHEDHAFPYPHGHISDAKGTFVGVDGGDTQLDEDGTPIDPAHPRTSLPVVVIPGRVGTDVMTYCDLPEWLSAYTYTGILQRLRREDAMFAPPAHATGTPRMQRLLAVTGFVHVAALVELASGSGSIEQVVPVDRAASSREAGAEVQLILSDASGGELRRLNVSATPISEHAAGLRPAAIDAYVPALPGLAQIGLAVKGRTVDTFRAGTEAPAAPTSPRLDSPRDRDFVGGKPRARLSWTTPREFASDGVRYIVEALGPGERWQAVAINVAGSAVTLRLEDVAGRPIRIYATNGFRRSAPVILEPGSAAAR